MRMDRNQLMELLAALNMALDLADSLYRSHGVVLDQGIVTKLQAARDLHQTMIQNLCPQLPNTDPTPDPIPSPTPTFEQEAPLYEKHSAQDIGPYGYLHYALTPATPQSHTLLLVPQSIADGWEGYCSCCNWSIFISFYRIEDKDELIAKIRERHHLHVYPNGQS
jgi:hypothetical protein